MVEKVLPILRYAPWEIRMICMEQMRMEARAKTIVSTVIWMEHLQRDISMEEMIEVCVPTWWLQMLV